MHAADSRTIGSELAPDVVAERRTVARVVIRFENRMGQLREQSGEILRTQRSFQVNFDACISGAGEHVPKHFDDFSSLGVCLDTGSVDKRKYDAGDPDQTAAIQQPNQMTCKLREFCWTRGDEGRSMK